MLSENRKNGSYDRGRGEKSGECEEGIFPVGGRSEEGSDLKKYLKIF
jgi:hypothetical protein